MLPFNVFCNMVNRKRFSLTSASIIEPMPVTTQVPVLAVRIMASSMYSPFISPTAMMTLSAIRPQVRSIIGAMASAIEAYTCVAPNLMACSRFHGLGSMAMTCLAPEITAPCSALMPMPPTPTMATVSPGWTCATLVAEPKPVGTAQPMMAADSNGMSLSILTTESLWTVMYGAKVPSRFIAATSLPPAV